jgi:RNA polymerase sigma-70 factor, ECF subfamily
MISDHELFALVKRNDIKAFDDLFIRYYSKLCRHAHKVVNNETMAEDVVQDLFIHLWENKEKIDITISVNAFLYTSTRNRALNAIRSVSIRDKHYKNIFEESETFSPDDANQVESNELFDFIEEAINSLPEKCREIFILHRKNNLTYNEIAAKLGLSAKTIENQIGIGLKKIKNYLIRYDINVIVLLIIRLCC